MAFFHDMMMNSSSTNSIPTYTYNGLYQVPTSTGSAIYTLNINNVSVGIPSPSRLFVMSIGARTYYGYSYIPTVTVNGQAATRVVKSQNSPTGYYDMNDIFSISLPSGTTANVVVATDDYFDKYALAFASYSLYDLTSQTPRTILSPTSNTVTFSSTRQGDIIIGLATSGTGVVWTGNMSGGIANNWSGTTASNGQSYYYPHLGASLAVTNQSSITYSLSTNDIANYSAHALWR